MKTIVCLLLGWVLCGVSFGASFEIKKDVIPFPGGEPKICYQYFERDGKKVLHGLYETFYASGAVWEKYYYKQGKLHGKCSEFNADGKKKWTGHYTQDLKTDLWTYWDRNGIKKLEILLDKKGVIQTLQRYNNLGKKSRQEWYKNGQVVKEKTWGEGERALAVTGNVGKDRKLGKLL